MKEEFGESKHSFYRLLKPKNDYHQHYRQNLIPSHLKTLKFNLSHGNKNLRFFEISSIYGAELSEQLLILSGLEKVFNQPFHNLNQELDFY
jgi:phenylalanyl-tRNA synthetase beta subunit